METSLVRAKAKTIAHHVHSEFTRLYTNYEADYGSASSAGIHSDKPEELSKASPIVARTAFVEWLKLRRIRVNDRTLQLSNGTIEEWADLFSELTGIDLDLSRLVPFTRRNLPTYDAVKEELTQLQRKHHQPWEGWHTLAKSLFNSDDPLDQTFLTKWLIGAASRVFFPGIDFQNVLVLQGAQGIGKSTFFKVLAGDFYAELTKATSDMDMTRLTIRNWLVVMDELESVTGAKETAQLKSYIQASKDDYRQLYTDIPVSHPRRCALGATANNQAILPDQTGNRRYWTMHIESINWAFLNEHRDIILAEAARRASQLEPFTLTDVEKAAQLNRVALFEQESQFQAPLAILTAKAESQPDLKHVVTTSDLYAALSITDRQRMYSKEVAAVLTKLGWKSARQSLNGIQQRCYTYGDGDIFVHKAENITGYIQSYRAKL